MRLTEEAQQYGVKCESKKNLVGRQDEATKKRSKGRLQVDTRGTRTKFLNKGKEQI